MALKGIKVGKEYLILPPDIALRFELVNTAFDFESIPAGLVWEFDIPVIGNEHILGFVHFVETKNKNRIYDATIIIGANEILGKIVTQKTGNVRYSCSFIMNGFSVDMLNKKLPEVITGSLAFPAPQVHQSMVNLANYCVARTWPEVDFNFPPYKNTAFYGTENPTFQDIINKWNIGTQSFDRNDKDVVNYNEHSLSPWLYLCYVVKEIFSSLGYSSGGSFFQHPEIKKLLLYNNYALDRVNDIFRGSYNGPDLPVALLTGESHVIPIDDVTTPPNSDPEELFNTATHEFTLDEYGEYAITCNINLTQTSGSPGDISIELWVDGVFAYGVLADPTNLQPFTFTLSQVNKKLTLRIFAMGDISYTLHSATFFVLKGYHPLLNVFSKTIEYKNHVPDVTVKDFLIALRKIPGLKITYAAGENKVDLDFNQDIFNAKRDDITNKAARDYDIEPNNGKGFTLVFDFEGDSLLDDNFPDLSELKKAGEFATYADLPEPTGVGYYAVVLNTNKIYRVVYDGPDLVWELFSDNYYDYVIGDGTQEIRSGFSPVFMIIGNMTGGHGIMPNIEQLGSTPAFTTGKNAFPLKLAIWHGMQPGFGGDYPLASALNRDFNGDVIGNLTLRWDDDTHGLYVTFFRKWINFLLNTETIIRQVKETVNDIFSDLFARKKTVRHVEHVYKKLTVEVTTNSVNESEVEKCKIL